jgi:hypothetical protein
VRCLFPRESRKADAGLSALMRIRQLIDVNIRTALLGEASSAPLWAGIMFIRAGALAVYGVFKLSVRHPRQIPAEPRLWMFQR